MRRHPLATLALVVGSLAALVVVLVGGGIAYAWWSAGIDTRGEVAFTRPLTIPPLAPSRTVDGVRTFSLTAQEGRADLGGEQPSRTWGFDGEHLGPTLRATRGEQIAVEVRNTQPERAEHGEGSEDPEEHGLAVAGHEVTSASSVRVWASTYSRWVSVAAETFPR